MLICTMVLNIPSTPANVLFFFRLFIICPLYLLGSLDFLSFNRNLLTASAWQCSTFCCGWSCSWNWQLGTFYCGWKCSAWNLLLQLKVLSLEPSIVAESAQPGTFYCDWKCSAWNLLLQLKVLSLEPSTAAESAQPGTFYCGWKCSAWNLLLWLKVLSLDPSTAAESAQPGTFYCHQPFPRAAPQCPQGCASALGWPGQGGCRSAEWPPEAIQHKPLLTGEHGLQKELITQANRQPVTAADLTSTTNENILWMWSELTALKIWEVKWGVHWSMQDSICLICYVITVFWSVM